MKKLTLLILSFLFVVPVYADAYYTNDNNLEFTEYQYNVLVDMIGEASVARLSAQEYEVYDVANMNEETHTYISEEENRAPFGINTYSYVETSYKKLTISATCNASYCTVTTINKWKQQPATRSYDLIGVRYEGTNCYDTSVTAFIVKTSSSQVITEHKGASNGYGSVGKLPSGPIDYVSHTVKILPQGVVFGSYQHATSSLSLANAKSFTFSSAGLGRVFYFSNTSIRNKYDGMQGVYLTLP